MGRIEPIKDSKMRPARCETTDLLLWVFAPSTENGRTVCGVTDSLQDGSLSCICTSYNQHPEWDPWNFNTGRSAGHRSEFEVQARDRSSITFPHNYPSLKSRDKLREVPGPS